MLSDWTRPGVSSARRLAVEEEYSKQIIAWLDKQFPEVRGHPAAVATVIRLHHLVGKGKLTRAEHGALILDAVAAYDLRWGT